MTEFNLADNPNDPADDLLAGTGLSYGLDLLLRRNVGRVTGWTTLSFLRAERTLPDPRRPGGRTCPPRSPSRPSTTAGWTSTWCCRPRPPWELELGARWNYGSSLPYSRPVGQYFAWRHDPISGEFEPAQDGGDDEEGEVPLFVIGGERNAERYPPYHRLDLTLRRTFQRGWGELTPYLQVLNAYNRRNNVLFYFYDYDRVPPVRSGISMFPILPAFGVEVRF